MLRTRERRGVRDRQDRARPPHQPQEPRRLDPPAQFGSTLTQEDHTVSRVDWRGYHTVSHLVYRDPEDEEDGVEEDRRKVGPERCQSRSIPLPALRAIRRSMALSQKQLAELAGVSANTVRLL